MFPNTTFFKMHMKRKHNKLRVLTAVSRHSAQRAHRSELIENTDTKRELPVFLSPRVPSCISPPAAAAAAVAAATCCHPTVSECAGR